MTVCKFKKLSCFFFGVILLFSCPIKASQSQRTERTNERKVKLTKLFKALHNQNNSYQEFLNDYNSGKPIDHNDLVCILNNPKLFSSLSTITSYKGQMVLRRLVDELGADLSILVGIVSNEQLIKILAVVAQDYTFLGNFCSVFLRKRCSAKGIMPELTKLILEVAKYCIENNYENCLENILKLFNREFHYSGIFINTSEASLMPSSVAPKALNNLRYLMEEGVNNNEDARKIFRQLYPSYQLAALNEIIDLIKKAIDENNGNENIIYTPLKNNERITQLIKIYFLPPSNTDHKQFSLLYNQAHYYPPPYHQIIELPTYYDLPTLCDGYIRKSFGDDIPKSICKIIEEKICSSSIFPYSSLLLSVKNGLNIFKIWSECNFPLPDNKELLMGALLSGNPIKAMGIVCNAQKTKKDREALQSSFKELKVHVMRKLFQEQFAVWVKDTLLNFKTSSSAFLLAHNDIVLSSYLCLHHELAAPSLFVSLMKEPRIRKLLNTPTALGNNIFMDMMRNRNYGDWWVSKQKLSIILDWLSKQENNGILNNLLITHENHHKENLLSLIIDKKLYTNLSLFEKALTLYAEAGGNLACKTQKSNLCYHLLLQAPSYKLIFVNEENPDFVNALDKLKNTCIKFKQEDNYWKMLINPPHNFPFEKYSYANGLYEKAFARQIEQLFKTLKQESSKGNSLNKNDIMRIYKNCFLSLPNRIPLFFKGILPYIIINDDKLLNQLKPDDEKEVALLPILLQAFEKELLFESISKFEDDKSAPVTFFHGIIKKERVTLIKYLLEKMINDTEFYEFISGFSENNELYRYMINNLPFDLFCKIYNHLFDVINRTHNPVKLRKIFQEKIIKSIFSILNPRKERADIIQPIEDDLEYKDRQSLERLRKYNAEILRQEEKKRAEGILCWLVENKKLDFQDMITQNIITEENLTIRLLDAEQGKECTMKDFLIRRGLYKPPEQEIQSVGTKRLDNFLKMLKRNEKAISIVVVLGIIVVIKLMCNGLLSKITKKRVRKDPSHQ